MAAFYLDTSGLVKRYVDEPGTVWVRGVTARSAGHDLFTVRLTGPETVAALIRKERMGEASLSLIQQLIEEFKGDWRDQYEIVEITPDLTDDAMELAARFGLRGYDAVHLAAALAIRTAYNRGRLADLTFVSADKQQLEAALVEGMTVENPNDRA